MTHVDLIEKLLRLVLKAMDRHSDFPSAYLRSAGTTQQNENERKRRFEDIVGRNSILQGSAQQMYEEHSKECPGLGKTVHTTCQHGSRMDNVRKSRQLCRPCCVHRLVGVFGTIHD